MDNCMIHGMEFRWVKSDSHIGGGFWWAELPFQKDGKAKVNVTYAEAMAAATSMGGDLPTDEEWVLGIGGDARVAPGSVWDWTKTEEGPFRVLRGGSWISGSRGLRAAFRNWYDPGDQSTSLGFRVVVRVREKVKPEPAKMIGRSNAEMALDQMGADGLTRNQTLAMYLVNAVDTARSEGAHPESAVAAFLDLVATESGDPGPENLNEIEAQVFMYDDGGVS